jgi:heme/copper-type cytochrome/quinol oxidase subunit 2
VKALKNFLQSSLGEYLTVAILFFVLAGVFLGLPLRLAQNTGLAFVAADTVSFYPPFRAAYVNEHGSDPLVHNSIIADNMMVYYSAYWSMYEHLLAQSDGGYNPYNFAGRAGSGPGGVSLILVGLPMLLAHALGEFSLLFTFEAIQNLTLAGIGMYVLLRWWKISIPSALTVSIMWMFAQHQFVWLQFPAHLRAQLFIPLILLLFERAFYRPTLWRLAQFGTVLGLTWSIGYTQITSYVLLFLGVYFWFLMFLRYRHNMGVFGSENRAKKANRGRSKHISAVEKFTKSIACYTPIGWRIVGFGLAICLLLGLGGLSVLRQAEGISTSIRGEQTTQHLPPCMVCSIQGLAESVALFVQPNVLGNHVQHPYSGFKNMVETGRYMTWWPFFIIAGGLWLQFRNPKWLSKMTPLQRAKSLFFVSFATVVYLLMQGTPGLTHAFYAVPYLNLGQATRMITLVLFCSLLATALWFDHVLNWFAAVKFQKKTRRNILTLAAAVGLTTGLVLGFVGFDSDWQIAQALTIMYGLVQWIFPFMTDLDARFFLIQAVTIPVLAFVYITWLHFWRRYGASKRSKKQSPSVSTRVDVRKALTYVLPVLIFIELLVFAYPFQSFSKTEQVLPPTELTSWLQQNTQEYRLLPSDTVYLPNINSVFNLKSISGYSTGIPRWYMDWVDSSFSEYNTTYNGYLQLPAERNGMVDQLATKYVLLEARGQEPVDLSGLDHVITLNDVHVYQNTRVWPRVWWTPRLCDPTHCKLEYDAEQDVEISAENWYRDGFTGSLNTDQHGTLVVSNIFSDNWKFISENEGIDDVYQTFQPFPVNERLTGFLLPQGSYEYSVEYVSISVLLWLQPLLLSLLVLWACIRWYIFRDPESVLFAVVIVLFLIAVTIPLFFTQRILEF